jgi:hypothetical protein
MAESYITRKGGGGAEDNRVLIKDTSNRVWYLFNQINYNASTQAFTPNTFLQERNYTGSNILFNNATVTITSASSTQGLFNTVTSTNLQVNASDLGSQKYTAIATNGAKFVAYNQFNYQTNTGVANVRPFESWYRENGATGKVLFNNAVMTATSGNFRGPNIVSNANNFPQLTTNATGNFYNIVSIFDNKVFITSTNQSASIPLRVYHFNGVLINQVTSNPLRTISFSGDDFDDGTHIFPKRLPFLKFFKSNLAVGTPAQGQVNAGGYTPYNNVIYTGYQWYSFITIQRRRTDNFAFLGNHSIPSDQLYGGDAVPSMTGHGEYIYLKGRAGNTSNFSNEQNTVLARSIHLYRTNDFVYHNSINVGLWTQGSGGDNSTYKLPNSNILAIDGFTSLTAGNSINGNSRVLRFYNLANNFQNLGQIGVTSPYFTPDRSNMAFDGNFLYTSNQNFVYKLNIYNLSGNPLLGQFDFGSSSNVVRPLAAASNIIYGMSGGFNYVSRQSFADENEIIPLFTINTIKDF